MLKNTNCSYDDFLNKRVKTHPIYTALPHLLHALSTLILLVFAINSSTHSTLGKSRVVFDRMKVCRVILLYTTTLHKPRKRNERRVEIYKTIFGLIYLKSPFFILTVNRKCRVCRVCRVKRKKFLKKISNLNF